MQRRSFFQWIAGSVSALFAARKARAQAPNQTIDAKAVHQLAVIVLPSSLGTAGIEKASANFVQWVQNYKPGAEMASGYGYPKTQVLGPSPSIHYAEQLAALDMTKAGVAKALDDAKIDRIPQRPSGKHVAADLLAFFYGSSDGEDFLYGAAIKRDDCRGLGNSAQRPAPLT